MQNIMNNTVANIWASMSEEERQDKILSVMDNVDAAIKFAAYEWNELPDGITNLIDSNAPLNELNKHKKLKRTMNKSTLKSLIRECYREVLAENEEMDLPSDTGKNINMGFDNNVGLATNKKVSNRISMLQSQINDLSKQLETNLKMYKAGQMSIADYKKVAAHIPGQLKQLASDLEIEMVKVSKI